MAEPAVRIPRTITVHLGTPSADVPDVAVPFAEYVKNAASCALCPIWEESALRAGVLAVGSFALSRVSSEFYRAHGNPFDITASAAFDQPYAHGRCVFANIARLADELFDCCLRRHGADGPLASAFCSGSPVGCDGMSLRGAQNLARQGYDAEEILRSYYGDGLEALTGVYAPPEGMAFPGAPLREGDTGPSVLWTQAALNRVSQLHPAIPRISPPDGVFGSSTSEAVSALRESFGLPAGKDVDKAVWYLLRRLGAAAAGLAALRAEGLSYGGASLAFPGLLREGSSGAGPSRLQYLLRVLAAFRPEIPAPPDSGTFDAGTRRAVLAFERLTGLPATGEADARVWDALCSAFEGISRLIFDNGSLFPAVDEPAPAATVPALQRQLRAAGAGRPELTGQLDAATRRALRIFQTSAGLPSTGQADGGTRAALAARCGDLRRALLCRFGQYPGFDLRLGMEDSWEVTT